VTNKNQEPATAADTTLTEGNVIDLSNVNDAPQDLDDATPTRPVRRAVVAEDEALIRMDVVETLREAGYDVVGEAGDGETAVKLAIELKPDVVVMDVKMPELDGISAAERIGKAHVAPVVLLTGFSQN